MIRKNLTGIYLLKDGDMDVLVYTYNIVNLETGKIEQMGVQEEVQMLSADMLRKGGVAVNPEVTAIDTIRAMISEKLNTHKK